MSTDIDLPSNTRSAVRQEPASQSTVIEQERARAEVEAAVFIAKKFPRDMAWARAEMRNQCSRMSTAGSAFYSVPNRGNGPSVHLARELARIWGNLDSGVRELSRDDVNGRSEIQAYAWDQETNSRNTRTFIVPHERMKGRDRVKLIDLGDIYLSNQNVGARAVRECLFAMMPRDFVEEAQDICRRTLEQGEGKPIEERIEQMVATFAGIHVTVEQLEAKVGRKIGSFSAADVAQMGIVYKSIKRDGLDKDEEFPPIVVSTDDIAPAVPTPSMGEPTPSMGTGPVTAADIVGEPPAAPPPAAPPKRAPKTSTPPDAGSEYGDVVKPAARTAPQSTEAVLSPEKLIVRLAAQHGVEGGDQVARMCSQIVGREVVGPVDFNPAETAKVKRFLEALAEDEPFQFVGEGVPVPVPSPDAKAADEATPSPQPSTPETADEWRSLMAECNVGPTAVVNWVRVGFPEFKNFSEVGALGIADDLAAWIREQKGESA